MSALKIRTSVDSWNDMLRSMRKADYIEVFGGSWKVYGDWKKTHDFPWPDGEEPVDLIAVVKWYREKFKGGATGDLNNAKLQAEIEKLKIQTARLNREEEEARGDLVKLSEIEAAVSVFLSCFSESMMTLPDIFTPRIPEKHAIEWTEEIRGDIERHLVRFSESVERTIGEVRSVVQIIDDAKACPKCKAEKVCPECPIT